MINDKKYSEFFLETMKEALKEINAELISTEWVDTNSIYKLKLKNGKIISDNYNNIIDCENQHIYHARINTNYLLENLRNKVEANGSKLLSTEWINTKTKYEVELANGIKFSATYDNLMARINWHRPHIVGKRISNDDKIKFMQNYANENNGKLIDTTWVDAKYKYLFEDDNQIQFNLTYKQVKLKQWTPDRGLVTEPACRQVFEYLFGYKFPKSRDVLTAAILNRKLPMELDGYCKELNIAFEYQGHESHWDNTHLRYNIVSNRDKIKKDMCKKLGIILFVIPVIKETANKWDCNNILNHVLNSVDNTYNQLKIKTPDLNKDNFKIDFSSINHGKEALENLSKIAIENNCTLISKEWRGFNSLHLFQDKYGREFKLSLHNIDYRGFPKDINKYINMQRPKDKQHYLDSMNNIAKQNGYELVDKNWHGRNYRYSFKNNNGNTYFIIGDYFNRFGWPKDIENFSEDNNNKRTNKSKTPLKDLQLFAENSGGKLISTEWKGQTKYHSFEWNDGTVFNGIPRKIYRDGWPKNIEKYIKLQQSILKSKQSHFEEFKTLIESHNAILLEDKWLGFKIDHRVMLENNQEILISPMYAKRNKYLVYTNSKNKII